MIWGASLLNAFANLSLFMADMASFSRQSGARSWAILVFCAVLSLTPSEALYSRKGPVSQLTTKTFGKMVLESDLPAVVEFYAPW